MQATLVIIGGKANKGHVVVNLPCVIGRSRQADLTVAHPMISRRHCELLYGDGVMRVRDLQSLNGTHVGGEKITEADLPPNSEFTIGPITFRVEYQPTAEASEPGAGAIPRSFPSSGATMGISSPPPPSTVEFLASDDEDQPLSDPAAGEPSGVLPVDDDLPVIAPPSGDLPDFEAWEAAVGGRSRLGQRRK